VLRHKLQQAEKATEAWHCSTTLPHGRDRPQKQVSLGSEHIAIADVSSLKPSSTLQRFCKRASVSCRRLARQSRTGSTTSFTGTEMLIPRLYLSVSRRICNAVAMCILLTFASARQWDSTILALGVLQESLSLSRNRLDRAIYSWASQVEHFGRKPGYQVLVFDNRGVGGSDTPEGLYKYVQVAG
jgi:hypothetical protein